MHHRMKKLGEDWAGWFETIGPNCGCSTQSYTVWAEPVEALLVRPDAVFAVRAELSKHSSCDVDPSIPQGERGYKLRSTEETRAMRTATELKPEP